MFSENKNFFQTVAKPNFERDKKSLVVFTVCTSLPKITKFLSYKPARAFANYFQRFFSVFIFNKAIISHHHLTKKTP